jgi:hypothetical protein
MPTFKHYPVNLIKSSVPVEVVKPIVQLDHSTAEAAPKLTENPITQAIAES